MLVISEAISSPTQTNPTANSIMMGIRSKKESGAKRMPTSKESGSRMNPCIRAPVPLPRALPITIDARETGATMISLRNPNSLSQIIETHDQTELKSSDNMPGKINIW
jgi:hypothetical protein